MDKKSLPLVILLGSFIVCVAYFGATLILKKESVEQRIPGNQIKQSLSRSKDDHNQVEMSDDISIQYLNEGPRHTEDTPGDVKHLTLLETIFGKGRYPYAIIRNELTQSQNVYNQGDIINGARIIHIHREKVTLSLNLQIYVLRTKTQADDQEVIHENLFTEPTLHEHRLGYHQQENIQVAWENTQQLMAQIEIDQYLNNGSPEGVIIHRIVENSVFDEIGFLPQDVILAVDEMEIEIEDDALEIYNCLRTQKRVEFKIQRDGKPQTLIYDQNNLN